MASAKRGRSSALAQQQKLAPIRVRAITQPTFTRYVFDLPELIGVSADNSRERLSLTFDAALRFDLADARATLPPMVESIESEADQDAAVVRFNFGARVDVRTFREDNSFVVDVETADRKTARQEGSVPSDELSTLAAELADRANATPPASAPQTMPQPPQAKPQPPQAPQAQPAAAGAAAASATASGGAAGGGRAAKSSAACAAGGHVTAGRPAASPATAVRTAAKRARCCSGADRAAGGARPGASAARHHRAGDSAARSRRWRCHPCRAQARRRESQHHTPVHGADAGRRLPARRFGVDGIRYRRGDRDFAR